MQQQLALAAGAMAVLAMPALALDLPEGTDPVIVEAYGACLNAIADGGFVDASVNWISHDSGDADAMLWSNFTHGYATKEVSNGGLSLSASVAQTPGRKLGRCSVDIDEPTVPIAAPDLAAAGFVGAVETYEQGWSGVWRNDDATLFVQARVPSDGESFVFTLTQMVEVP